MHQTIRRLAFAALCAFALGALPSFASTAHDPQPIGVSATVPIGAEVTMSPTEGPPFAGTPACAMCPGEFRDLSAVAHNMILRAERGDWVAFREKIEDLRASVARAHLVPTTASEIMALRAAADVFCTSQSKADFDKLAAASAAVRPLSDAHFADPVHSHGELRGKPVARSEPQPEPILQFFGYGHLPPRLQMVSKPFHDLAHAIVRGDNVPEAGNVTLGSPLPRNAERTVALRKLLEAKDAAVRALVAQS